LNEDSPEWPLTTVVGRASAVLEKASNEVPPIYNVPRAPHESALRKFVSFQDDVLVVLGPRRVPPILAPPPNTATSISISTSIGFCQLEAEYYIEAIQQLRPDIVVGLADIEPGKVPGVKRREKMADRTHAYTRDATRQLYEEDGCVDELDLKTLYFAPILPLENTQQQLYLGQLADELREHISGLALYGSSSLAAVPEELGDLPRLSLGAQETPHDVLRDIGLGVDLMTIPFIGAASDGGIALDFVFPPKKDESRSGRQNNPKPLGIDMWSPSHATDLSPLVQGCQCYTCTKHHRAYLRHLLSAKEMLAWTLLQIHNHHIIDGFFSGIRESITNGTFEEGVQAFEQVYESCLPQQTGHGPRYVYKYICRPSCASCPRSTLLTDPDSGATNLTPPAPANQDGILVPTTA
jgi:queuine tRNA-ribosyltransferase subunit QTRTD1